MKQYLDLVEKIISFGNDKKDRTGTSTKSLFGYQMRFDLSEGFPLVTVKKTWFKGVVHELLWMISGSTNIKYLVDNKVHIWDDWQDEYGTIGKGYGYQWRRWPKIELINPLESSFVFSGKSIGKIAGYGNNPKKITNKHLYNIWSEMLHRCFDPKRKHFKWYGKESVVVCDQWLNYEQFEKDIKNLPGWEQKQNDSENFSLDKDYLGGKIYAPDTCMWLSNQDQRLNTRNTRLVEITLPNGSKLFEVDIKYFCENYDLDYSTVTKCIRNERERHKGFKFSVVDTGDKLVRIQRIDQLTNVINQIKKNPDDRRMIVSAWNPADIDKMQLPPCHMMFQFYVHEGKLSCQMYQRSADVFLGVPFNIASYALLTMMVAQVTGNQPGEFIHTIGDAHLYKNHWQQSCIMLKREPMPLARVKLNPNISNIEAFKFEDIVLEDYNHHPALKGEVSV